ncbi:signal peptidase I [Mycoplasmatota bacterium]|nr:signal peptidase I [Mycoplasmatota bacterium]
MKILKKFLTYIPILMIGISMVLVLSLGYALINNQIPSILNKSILYVQTESMEDTIMAGDMIIINQKYDNLAVDDIVSYRKSDQLNIIITHRIVEINQIGDESFITTKGDNNQSIADWETNFSEDLIIGKYNGQKSTFLGSIYKSLFLSNFNIIFLVILFIFVIIIVLEAMNIIKTINDHKLEKEKKLYVQEEKERLRKEKDDR